LEEKERESGLIDVDLPPKKRVADAGEDFRIEVHRHRDDLIAKDRVDARGGAASKDKVDGGRGIQDDQSG
jgi:hypothetical protein